MQHMKAVGAVGEVSQGAALQSNMRASPAARSLAGVCLATAAAQQCYGYGPTGYGYGYGRYYGYGGVAGGAYGTSGTYGVRTACRRAYVHARTEGLHGLTACPQGPCMTPMLCCFAFLAMLASACVAWGRMHNNHHTCALLAPPSTAPLVP